jgi:hypothetical protein
MAALAAKGEKASRPLIDAFLKSTGQEVAHLDKNMNLCGPADAAVVIRNGTILACGAVGIAAYLIYLYKNGMLKWDPFGWDCLHPMDGGAAGKALGTWFDIAKYGSPALMLATNVNAQEGYLTGIAAGSPILAVAKAMGWLKLKK